MPVIAGRLIFYNTFLSAFFSVMRATIVVDFFCFFFRKVTEFKMIFFSVLAGFVKMGQVNGLEDTNCFHIVRKLKKMRDKLCIFHFI